MILILCFLKLGERKSDADQTLYKESWEVDPLLPSLSLTGSTATQVSSLTFSITPSFALSNHTLHTLTGCMDAISR